jgi:hypothetical protein
MYCHVKLLSTNFSEVRAASIIRVMMMEAARTSEKSVDNYFTRQYIPEDKSELHTFLCMHMHMHIYEYEEQDNYEKTRRNKHIYNFFFIVKVKKHINWISSPFCILLNIGDIWEIHFFHFFWNI